MSDSPPTASFPSADRVRSLVAGLLGAALAVTLVAQLATIVTAQTPVPNSLSQLAASIAREGTYVSPRLSAEVPLAAEARLQRTLNGASLHGVTLRMAVLDQVPTPYRTLEDFATALYDALALPDSVLVVATPHGVAARSTRLSASQIAHQVASSQPVFERDGYVRAMEAVADGLVSDVLTLAPPALAATPAQVSAPTLDRVLVRRGADPLSSVSLLTLFTLAVLLGGYLWLARRVSRQQVAAVLALRDEAAARLNDPVSKRDRGAMETARRSFDIGNRALDSLRALPWWRTSLVPWSPPQQLQLADRAYAGVIHSLSNPAATSAPAGAAAPGGAGEGTRSTTPVIDRPPQSASDLPASGSGSLQVAPTADGSGADGLSPVMAARPAVSPDLDSPTTEIVPPPAVMPLQPSAPTVPPASAAELTPRKRRMSWLGRKVERVPVPSASLDPERVLAGLRPEAPVACFFCGSPLRAQHVEVGTVPLAGQPLHPLLCHRHASALAADERPPVWARTIEGDQLVPWFRDPRYLPAWDYDPDVVDPALPWDQLPPPDQLLAGPIRVVVHADDPRWAAA